MFTNDLHFANETVTFDFLTVRHKGKFSKMGNLVDKTQGSTLESQTIFQAKLFLLNRAPPPALRLPELLRVPGAGAVRQDRGRRELLRLPHRVPARPLGVWPVRGRGRVQGLLPQGLRRGRRLHQHAGLIHLPGQSIGCQGWTRKCS